MSTVHSLTSPEGASLEPAHEEVIDRGLATFIEVGQALLAIRDRRLYRMAYATF